MIEILLRCPLLAVAGPMNFPVRVKQRSIYAIEAVKMQVETNFIGKPNVMHLSLIHI